MEWDVGCRMGNGGMDVGRGVWVGVGGGALIWTGMSSAELPVECFPSTVHMDYPKKYRERDRQRAVVQCLGTPCPRAPPGPLDVLHLMPSVVQGHCPPPQDAPPPPQDPLPPLLPLLYIS